MTHSSTTPTITILGLPFSTLSAEDLIKSLDAGGLLVAPSAPGLTTLNDDPAYEAALLSAKWIIPDSGFMVLVWNLFNAERIHRCSGLKLFRALIQHTKTKPEIKLFLVNPSVEHSQTNLQWLGHNGLQTQEEQHYAAPVYSQRPITDPKLVALIEAQKPDCVLINIGGGAQELLGQHLLENLSYKPSILCTGAAIAFLTGCQVYIPPWADRYYLGWLFRTFAQPKLFFPRYFKALKLLPQMLKSFH